MKVVIIIVLVILLLIGWAWWGHVGMDRIFDKPFRYRECKPEKLLPELESCFDINFPEEIEQIQTSHTPGGWDSSVSEFIVRFSANPNTVEALLDTFPPKTKIDVYTPVDDDRSVGAAGLRTPDWFLKPIEKGKIAHTPSGQPEVYIDTINKDTFIVYIHGLYYREPNEIAEELRKERLRN